MDRHLSRLPVCLPSAVLECHSHMQAVASGDGTHCTQAGNGAANDAGGPRRARKRTAAEALGGGNASQDPLDPELVKRCAHHHHIGNSVKMEDFRMSPRGLHCQRGCCTLGAHAELQQSPRARCRRDKNREAAQQSRQRKAMLLANLESTVTCQQAEIERLAGCVAAAKRQADRQKAEKRRLQVRFHQAAHACTGQHQSCLCDP